MRDVKKKLSSYETLVVNVLKSRPQASAADIAWVLYHGEDKIKAKTPQVSVVLKRLEKKGYVQRVKKEGRKAYYRVIIEPEAIPRTATDEMIRDFAGYFEHVHKKTPKTIKKMVEEVVEELETASASEIAKRLFPKHERKRVKTSQIYVTLRRLEAEGKLERTEKRGRKTHFRVAVPEPAEPVEERPAVPRPEPHIERPHVPRHEPPHRPEMKRPRIPRPRVPRFHVPRSLVLAAVVIILVAGIAAFNFYPLGFVVLQEETVTGEGFQLSLQKLDEDSYRYIIRNVKGTPLNDIEATVKMGKDSSIIDPGSADADEGDTDPYEHSLSWKIDKLTPNEEAQFEFDADIIGWVELGSKGFSKTLDEETASSSEGTVEAGSSIYRQIHSDKPVTEISFSLSVLFAEEVVENITENITLPVQNITENITENVTQNITQNITENITQNITENITENITQPEQNITENVTQNETIEENQTEETSDITGEFLAEAATVGIYLDSDSEMNGNEHIITERITSDDFSEVFDVYVPDDYSGDFYIVVNSTHETSISINNVKMFSTSGEKSEDSGDIMFKEEEKGVGILWGGGDDDDDDICEDDDDNDDENDDDNGDDENDEDECEEDKKKTCDYGEEDLESLTVLLPIMDDTIDEKHPYHTTCSVNKLRVWDKVNKTRRTLIQFNLSDIPDNSLITSARLKMYLQVGTQDYIDIDVHKIEKAWMEGEVSWMNASSGDSWNNSGGDFNSYVEASELVDNDKEYKSWNVTDSVQDWTDGETNYGFLLKAKYEQQPANNKKEFWSRNYHHVCKRPVLIINYTNVTGDVTPPIVTLIEPAAGGNSTANVTFVYTVNDTSNITECSLIINGEVNQTDTSITKEINQTFEQILLDNVSWAVRCTDEFDNTETSETRNLTVIPVFNFWEDVTDSEGNPFLSEVIIRDENGTIIFNSTDTSHQTTIPPGTFDITVTPMEEAPIINVTFVDVIINGDVNQLVDFEQMFSDIVFLDPNVIYNDLFSLDPVLQMQFDHIEYTAVAQGPNLYKCRIFDFETRRCLGQWIKIRRDLIPGQVYRQILKDASDPAFGEGEDKIVLKDIEIDGNITDWDSVLDTENNVMSDGISGSTDLDDVGSAGRDLTKFAFTWNDTYLFTYFRRVAAPSAAVSMLVYVDSDRDGYMNSTDNVVKFTWYGASREYDSYIYDYVPSGTADILTGDGTDMPGSITNGTSLESDILGAGEEGVQLESRINWTDLGVSAGTPLKFHISSARGEGTNLPTQVEDNMNITDTLVASVDIFPNNDGGGQANSVKSYTHTVQNLGNDVDVFDIIAESNWGFNITLYFTNGTSLTDTNSNSFVDIGKLDPDENVSIMVNISINNISSGANDVTTVKANSSSGASDSVIDITNIGDISIVPGIIGRVTNNTLVTYNHTVINNLGTTEVIDMNATSNQGFTVGLYHRNGTALADTDNDTIIDIGSVAPGGEVNITLRIMTGNVSIGTLDKTTITANASSSPASSGSAVDKTTIAEQIEVEPDHDDVAGIGSSVFYEHEVFNNGNLSDVIDINISSSLGWTVELFESDRITPLSDTDSDTIPDVGTVLPIGGSEKIIVKVTVPGTASEGDMDVTNVTGLSSVSSATEMAQDDTTAEILVIYNNSARTLKDTFFTIGETVYTKAFGLVDENKVIFTWVDGNATTVRVSPEINVDALDQAIDQFTTNMSHVPGNWTLVLTDKFNNEITRTDFIVADGNPPNVTNVTPLADTVFNVSDTVTISANVTDDTAVDTVLANITYPNSSSVLLQLVNISNTSAYYAANFTDTLQMGTYNVTIIANDTFGAVNNTEKTNFTIFTPIISISLVQSTVDFGTMLPNQTNSTSDNSPYPFEIRNDGNVKVNISVNATDLFPTTPNPTSNYQMAVNSSSEGSPYTSSCSLTSFTNVPSVSTLFICFLDWVNATDQAEMEVEITVPWSEGAGAKNSTIVFIATQA